MEAYLEYVKDCTHKLAAAGSMIEEEDLIFLHLMAYHQSLTP